jgi:Tol biopolymer transport system component
VFSNGQVVLANSDGTDSHVLTNDSSIIYSPALSPDGSRIAFVATQDGNPEIYVMNTDGSGRIRLTNNSVIDQDPTWSPDGLQIAFSSNRSGNFDIYKMDSTFGVPVTQLTTSPNNESQPDWSSTGKIAFTTDVNVAGFHHWDIFTMNASDGSSQTDLTNNAPSASNVDPAWSPDGSKIAFIGGTSGAPAYTMNANGSGVTSVTSGLGGALDPAWSPDGTRLLFESGSSDVYSAKTDGTMLARLTSGLNVQSAPSESPAVVPPQAWVSG